MANKSHGRFEDKHKAVIELLLRRFGSAPKGSVIQYEDIEQAMGSGRYQTPGQSIFKRFRRDMEKRGIITRCIPQVGLKLVSDEDGPVDVHLLRTRKRFRQCGFQLREGAVLNPAKMSLHARLVHAKHMDNAEVERSDIRRSLHETEEALKPSGTHPTRKLPEPKARDNDDDAAT